MRLPILVAVLAAILLAAACSSDGEVAEVASVEEAESTSTSDSADGDSTAIAGADDGADGDQGDGAGEGEGHDDDSAEAAGEEFSTPLVDEERREGIPMTPSDYVVGYYGDSVAASIEEKFVAFLDWGLRIKTLSRAFPGSATCVFQRDLEGDVASGQLWGAVLLYSNNVFPECMWDEDGNPLEGEPKWEKYEADTRLAVQTLVDGGVRVYLPTLALTRTEVEDELPASQRINDISAQLADEYDLVFLVDAAPSVLTPSGAYAEYLPCLMWEPCLNGETEDGTEVNLVRQFDGAHFCTGGYEDYEAQEGLCPAWASGQVRYARAVTQPIIEDAYAEFTGSD
jgi:hypothetical protein